MDKVIDLKTYKGARFLAYSEAVSRASLADIRQGLPEQKPEQRHYEQAVELRQAHLKKAPLEP